MCLDEKSGNIYKNIPWQNFVKSGDDSGRTKKPTDIYVHNWPLESFDQKLFKLRDSLHKVANSMEHIEFN